MTTQFSLEPEDYSRYAAWRRSRGKLAGRRSKRRVVRKLPQTIMVVPVVKPPGGRLSDFRSALNRHKALAYGVLLAAVIDAYIYAGDRDQVHDLLGTVNSVVQDARSFYFGA